MPKIEHMVNRSIASASSHVHKADELVEMAHMELYNNAQHLMNSIEPKKMSAAGTEALERVKKALKKLSQVRADLSDAVYQIEVAQRKLDL